MGDDILSIIFLILICIVITVIAMHVSSASMGVPVFIMISACIWIGYDYIMLKRYKAKEKCAKKKATVETTDELDRQISELQDELDDYIDDNLEVPEKPKIEPPEKKHKNEFDIDLYDRHLSVQELYKDMGSAGDTRIASRMKYMALQPRMSREIQARMNSEKLRPYFEEEFREQENKDWWDVANDHLDALM